MARDCSRGWKESVVTSIGIAELKSTLSRVLDRVKDGEVITVTDHGRPVAHLVPIVPSALPDADRLRELERRGVLRMGSEPLDDRFWQLPRPDDPEGASLQAVLDEREHGR